VTDDGFLAYSKDADIYGPMLAFLQSYCCHLNSSAFKNSCRCRHSTLVTLPSPTAMHQCQCNASSGNSAGLNSETLVSLTAAAEGEIGVGILVSISPIESVLL